MLAFELPPFRELKYVRTCTDGTAMTIKPPRGFIKVTIPKTIEVKGRIKLLPNVVEVYFVLPLKEKK